MATILYDQAMSLPTSLRKEIERIVRQVESALTVELPPLIVQIDCSHATSPRNFAAILARNPTYLYLCEDFALQPVTRVRGILFHQLGHVLQWAQKLYDFSIVPKPPRQLDSEQQADWLIENMCGVTIFYDDELVQRAGPGAKGRWPRPKNLR